MVESISFLDVPFVVVAGTRSEPSGLRFGFGQPEGWLMPAGRQVE
mgnify:FL=1